MADRNPAPRARRRRRRRHPRRDARDEAARHRRRRRTAISRWRTKTSRSSSSTTARSTTRRRSAQDLERRGVRFRTRSDTEVILRLYEHDPEHVEEHLVGMWAFAIHDRRRRRVVLSRDRFGIKPLFVADTGSALAFASELRCFDRSLEPFRAAVRDRSRRRARDGLVELRPGERARSTRACAASPPATRLTIDLATGERDTRTLLDARAVAARRPACARSTRPASTSRRCSGAP